MGTRILLVSQRSLSLSHALVNESFSDVPDRSSGLQVELWERGQLWDKLLGLCLIRLDTRERRGGGGDDDEEEEEEAEERWLTLDAELILNRQGQVTRTCQPTSHSILIRTHVELPSDLSEQESKELTEKLELLHQILDQQGRHLQDVTFDELNSLSTMHNEQPTVSHFPLCSAPTRATSDSRWVCLLDEKRDPTCAFSTQTSRHTSDD